MPIPKDVIFTGAKALKIVKLRRTQGMDDIAVRLNADLNPGEQLQAATWGAAFELATTTKDPYTIADQLERLFTRKG